MRTDGLEMAGHFEQGRSGQLQTADMVRGQRHPPDLSRRLGPGSMVHDFHLWAVSGQEGEQFELAQRLSCH